MSTYKTSHTVEQGFYRHFKGALYYVEGVASDQSKFHRHEEPLVVYHPVAEPQYPGAVRTPDFKTIYVRTLSNWCARVHRKGDLVQRFTKED
jgi:hypothetical protein